MIELLTPGTVWSRSVKGKMLETTVIGVTNTHLTGKRAEENPPQVIFVDSRGRWSSMDAQRYMRSRVFETTNTVVAHNVDTLFQEKPQVATAEDPSPITTAMQAGTLPEPKHVITLGDVEYDISGVLIAYNQRPDFVTRAVVHELIFAADIAVMGAEGEDAVSLFATLPERLSFNIGGGDIEASNMGVYPLLSGGENMLTLYLAEASTEGEDGALEEVQPIEEPLVEETQVQETQEPQAQVQDVVTPVEVQAAPVQESVEVVAPLVTPTVVQEQQVESVTPVVQATSAVEQDPQVVVQQEAEQEQPQTFQEKLQAVLKTEE